MTADAFLTFALAFVVALVVASLLEYWMHRLMHHTRFYRRVHTRHHKLASGKGWLGEFADYMLATLATSWVAFLHSTVAGVGFFLGATIFSAVAAYAHQLQHEAPNRVFWMPMPVHAVHHFHQEWSHNFGITSGIWDRVFGTYLRHEPIPEFEGLRIGGLSDIHWASRSQPLPVRNRCRRKANTQ